jgi:hypothetical protein
LHVFDVSPSMAAMGDDAFVLGVDLDGGCGDFYLAMRPIVAEWLGVDEDERRYERKLWMRDLMMGVAYPPVDL